MYLELYSTFLVEFLKSIITVTIEIAFLKRAQWWSEALCSIHLLCLAYELTYAALSLHLLICSLVVVHWVSIIVLIRLQVIVYFIV